MAARGDAVFAELRADFAGLVYSTFLGGDGWDTGRAAYVGADGTFYMVGQSDGAGWPGTESRSALAALPRPRASAAWFSGGWRLALRTLNERPAGLPWPKCLSYCAPLAALALRHATCEYTSGRRPC